MTRSNLTRQLVSFVIGQGAGQIIGFFSALLILRSLSTDDYAFFVFAFGFQSAIGLIVDSGVSNSIVALVGHQVSDQKEIGLRLYAAMAYRRQMIIPTVLVVTPAFFYFGNRLGTPLPTVLTCLAIMVASIVLQQGTMYNAVLRIVGDVRGLYRCVNLGALARLAVVLGLAAAGAVTTTTALATNIVNLFVSVGLLRIAAHRFAPKPDHVPRSFRSEARHYVAPLLPGAIFQAVQGQVSILIGGALGASRSIAEVGALSRLGQVGIFITGFNGLFLEPVFARTTARRARRLLLVAGCVTAAACAVLLVVIALIPGLTGFVLGDAYADLTYELQLTFALVFLSGISHQAYLFNVARRYLYWWYTVATIVTAIAAQVVAVLLVDTSSTSGLIWISIVGVASGWAVHLTALTVGSIRGPRTLDGLRRSRGRHVKD